MKKPTKLQTVMKAFLDNPAVWFTMKSGILLENGNMYYPNNIFDSCKMLERIKLPTGRKMRFEREWVYNNYSGKRNYCKIKLQDDLTTEELEWLSNPKNIKSVRILKSNSVFDGIKTELYDNLLAKLGF